MLIGPEQHAILVRLAKRDGRSVADITRRVIALGLEQLTQKDALAARARALRRADALAEQIGSRTGHFADVDVVEDLRRLREERDEQLAGGC